MIRGRLRGWLSSRRSLKRPQLPGSPALVWSRGQLAGCARLAATATLDPEGAARTLRLAAGVVGACCAEVGGMVGCVGIVAGEEPVVVPLAAKRDVVATRVLGTVTAVPAHRHPLLLLSLARGVYLASLVDPQTPFAFDEAQVVTWLVDGSVVLAILVETVTGDGGAALRLTTYGSRRRLVSLLAICRSTVGELSGAMSTR